MKIKTVVTNKKRHQLRKMVLELTEGVDTKTKEIHQLKVKLIRSEEALKSLTEKLIAQKRITEEVVKGNEEMAKDYYTQSKDVNRLTDVVIAANMEIERRDSIINNLNDTIRILQAKVINLSDEVDNLKQPFWKKLLK